MITGTASGRKPETGAGPRNTPHSHTEALCEEVIWWHNQIYGLDLKLADIRTRLRIAPVVQCRADCMYRIRREKGWSYPRIARWFGNMDHTTVMHHVKRTDTATKPIKNIVGRSMIELLVKAEQNRAKKARYRAMGKTETATGVNNEIA